MFVPAKPIPLHPSRIYSLKLDEEFNIPSGMGGAFTVRFDGYRCEKTIADFTIVSSSPPPEGWNGCTRSFKTEDLPGILSAHPSPPDSPYYDGGQRELKALRQMGHPEDSEEITTLLRRFPKLATS